MEEQIIEFVKNHEFLYDKRHKHFKNIGLRNRAFSKLSEQTNVPERKLKERWRTLKDHFYKELRWKSNHGSTYFKKREWKWMDKMMFLKDMFPPNFVRTTQTKIEYIKEDDDSIIELLESSPAHNTYDEATNDNEQTESVSMDGMEKMITIPEQEEWPREKSYIQLFFECLAKQTEEADLPPRKIAELQLELLTTFNRIVYSNS